MKARSLREALGPLLVLSLFFGVLPRRRESSGWIKLLANASLCLVVAVVVLFLYFICNNGVRHLSQTEIVTLGFFILLSILTATVNCASHVLRKDEAFSAVVTQIAGVDSVLGVDPSVYGETKKRVMVAIAGILGCYLLASLVAATGKLGSFIVFIFLDLNIVLTEFQFVSLVLTLNQRFLILNQKLCVYSQDKAGKKPAVSSIAFRVRSLSPRMVTSVSDEAITNLQRVHFTLTMLGRRVNRFYGLQNAANVVLQFLSITYVIFDLMKILSEGGTVMKQGDWARYSSLLLLPMAKVVALAVSCQKTETSASSTALLLSGRQLRHWKQHQTKDRAVEAFSKQVDSLYLKFDAWSLFFIDGPLLRVVGSTIVTYTIILLQFSVVEDQNESGDPCNQTTNHQD